jgi:Amt family ammonium transporter
MKAPVLTDSAALLAVVSTLLIPLAVAGLSLINAGFGRSRNAAHMMMACLCVAGMAVVTYVVFGFGWQGVAGGPSRVVAIAGKTWDVTARQPLFLRGVDFAGSPASLVAWMQILAVSLAAMIPLGAAAERWRLGAMLASTAILSGITYPLFAHWAWGGGWLSQLGVQYGLGHGFVDLGGSGVVQALGGLTALTVVWILGPRRGKYTAEGMPTAIPAHNAVFVLFGCLLAWAGWLGLNVSGSLLFGGVDPGRAVLVAVNTSLGAGSAALTTAIATRVRFGKPDASLSANGWVAGLAAGSAGCAVVPPAAAILTGILAGFLVPFAIENLELRLSIDDPGGAIAVHAFGGIWGLLAVGPFGRFPTTGFAGGGDSGQWMAQLIGVATLIGFILPLSYGLNWLLNRLMPQRVPPEGERQGLDLYELGAGAYPEFQTHSDEFMQR